MPVVFSNTVRVINPSPSPRNSPRSSVTPRTRQSGKESRSPKTHSRGRKRKTKVKNAKKSKRGSQKKRSRRASRRQRGGGDSTKECRTKLLKCGLKDNLSDTRFLSTDAKELSDLYYEYKKNGESGSKEDIINNFVDIFKKIVNKTEYNKGQVFKIEDTSTISDEGENLKVYLSRKLEHAKTNSSLNNQINLTDFIYTLINGSLGTFLCNQIKT